jgi:hypothetical protein
MPPNEPLRHLRIDDRAHAERYTTPLVPRGPFKTPVRDRVPHGEGLLGQLDQAEADAQARQPEQEEKKEKGIVLEFRGHPEFELFVKSLENAQQGIELLNVREDGPVSVASVFVPPGKLAHFRKRIQQYIGEETEKGNAKHRDLVQSITSIGYVAIRSYWTDEGDFPPEDKPLCWEVWLRTKGNPEPDLNIFRGEAQAQGLTVHPRFLTFPDRVVVLVTGSAQQLEGSLDLLDLIAELRLAKECPTTFTNMRFHEQAEWVEEAVTRIVPPASDAVAVCVLDSGVDYAQPLLKPAIDEEHALTCFPGTSPTDHNGHGSEMAGLSLYGDLTEPLTATGPIELRHRLESVQILPKVGKNHPDLYGSITAEAIGRIETVSPTRPRVFCMAVTTTDFRDRGLPSSWSAELDQLAFGETLESPKRLILVSGGNTDPTQRHNCPDSNYTDGIHDPGQSWNAVTVGAYTRKDSIRSKDYADYRPVAPHGSLSPSSTTSLIWNRSWPLKPEIVMEGGNEAIGPSFPESDPIEDLQLLTTSRFQHGKLLVASGDTSAATALASRLAASIQAEYPTYWPETIRALMVHSAEWTPAMLSEFEGEKKSVCQNRLRCYGYGVPNLERALWCARNALCLVSQAEVQPYEKPEGKAPKTRDMHFYELPWPVKELQELGEQDVTMRVTLSYFIEPSPGRRGWKYKHRYASHGLRFDVNHPTESGEEFRKRINKQAREEEEEVESSDSQKWTLGSQLRSRGSLHSDWWTGPATDLAKTGFIGVYPVVGWWRERPQFEKYNRSVRYSLVVSIHTASQEVDLYTPVTVQLAIPTTIAIE